ncbi:MFS transporter [Glycomyces harbinensis]|uniref:Predicted arabinose efflux permease, MFS family n=1 Tax=Glycomyces harbinensis TaxID=58114 RepID=A0A1G7AQ16_9ACTN|nr:MFS transporter [Glycomyces harbinensis]SDE16901.1 Predicted arabinose efflux permease, MFS family [Glycomyces harbinensis]
MLSVLRHRAYRRLFAAQAIALAGTGLATVALSLLAYDLAGARAGAVLGTALAIKMLAYLLIGPVATALAERVSRRTLMAAMDIARAAVALALPFVTEIWQVYVLVLVLQAASAAFTPTFQATLPDVLPREADYTKALSLSRLAYDLESLVSPVLAAGLLALVGYQWLFTGTTVGFLASAVLVGSVVLPKPGPTGGGRWATTTRGFRLYLATPRLRGLLLMHLAVAASTAMVVVNTVVLVRDGLGRGGGDVAIALGAYGTGSMAAALLLPGLLKRRTDRQVMIPAACTLAAGLIVLAAALSGDLLGWAALLAIWAVLGAATGAILTPTGRLVTASATAGDRPAAFAAQFSLSHGWFLVTYPLAGWLAAQAGMSAAAAALAVVAAAAAIAGPVVWPRRETQALAHVHARLGPDDPHLTGARAAPEGWSHSHDYVIDALHRHWPENRSGRPCDERRQDRRTAAASSAK